MKNSFSTLFFSFLIILFSCNRDQQHDSIKWNHLVESNNFLTDVIIEDIFTPPVASRIYAYTNIAAHEVIAYESDSIIPFNGRLNELEYKVSSRKRFNKDVASFVAFNKVAEKLVFDEERIRSRVVRKIDSLKRIHSDNLIDESYDFGIQIAEIIIDWLNKDGYNERTGLPRYSPKDSLGVWVPTPPDYMSGIEPHWNTLRPFVIDSVNQFSPPSPTKFDTLKNSEFYRETLEVYNAVKDASINEVEIAKFWDCNPNISYHRGHMMFFEQKLTPGGHWIEITQQVLRNENADLDESARTFALVSISLADGFLSCWDEKYRSSLIRPETYINRYIDENWKPILQTPAFPEYTSGHSVISSSAAQTLTYLYGETYSFIDSTEVEFGLPARQFDSFIDASNEAAISRLYGGIHYKPAIENGVAQGRGIADFIKNKLGY